MISVSIFFHWNIRLFCVKSPSIGPFQFILIVFLLFRFQPSIVINAILTIILNVMICVPIYLITWASFISHVRIHTIWIILSFIVDLILTKWDINWYYRVFDDKGGIDEEGREPFCRTITYKCKIDQRR